MSNDMNASDAWAGVGALTDPVRRRLYEYVVAEGRPVRRDEAAAANGISRTLAAYHLDLLTRAQLLVAGYARPDGRDGPGAGRPAKHYEPARREVAVSVPPRNYTLLARLLADAVADTAAGAPSSALRSTLHDNAESEGRAAAQSGKTLPATLTDDGYEPARTDRGDIEMRNCPFHSLSQRHTDLVCGLNHAFLRGTLAGLGDEPDRAELDPQVGRCCVVIHPLDSSAP